MTANILKTTALAAALVMGGISSAYAAPDDFNTSFDDDYWGNAPGSWTDVVGTAADFDSTSGTIQKSGNTLIVVISSEYADTVIGTAVTPSNTGATGSTHLGDLFIGIDTAPTINGAYAVANPGADAPEITQDDTYTADTGRYTHAVVTDGLYAGVDGALLDADLYNMGTDGGDVQLSYFPDSNTGNTSGTSFRNDQAVEYTPDDTNNELLNAQWSLNKSAKTITFTIADFFTLSDFTDPISANNAQLLTIAFTMTCANDVIQYTQALAYSAVPDVPLPAGMVLLLSGLLGMGFLGRYRRKTA